MPGGIEMLGGLGSLRRPIGDPEGQTDENEKE
jgi:hypothetical protein